MKCGKLNVKGHGKWKQRGKSNVNVDLKAIGKPTVVIHRYHYSTSIDEPCSPYTNNSNNYTFPAGDQV
jgi:hypothetical protein